MTNRIVFFDFKIIIIVLMIGYLQSQVRKKFEYLRRCYKTYLLDSFITLLLITIHIIIFKLISHYLKSTKECGSKFGCFGFPQGCQDTQCTFIYKWSTNRNESSNDFVIAAKISQIATELSWIAIGFSKDNQMVN
jgi:hypothetical protein